MSGTNEGAKGWLGVLGWSAYLACSWTWCIGMFLPVLLVRDYGLWGFVVFAAPNVVGAAAMGWVLRDGAAERIVEKHGWTCRAFAIVTMLFQAYFVFAYLGQGFFAGTLFGEVGARNSRWLLLAFLVPIPLALVRYGGLVVWVLSAVLIWAAYSFGGIGIPMQGPARVPPDLTWLAPVCVFGFALSPYLDLTFLRARIANRHAQASVAFTIGFGVLFFAAILATLGYAGVALRSLSGGSVPAGVSLALACYVMMQAVYTIGVQACEVSRLSRVRQAARAAGNRRGPRAMIDWVLTIAVMGLGVGGLLTILAVKVDAEGWFAATGLEAREVIYRCFMSFYGLVFPAYVWLCMIPTRDGHSGVGGARGRWKLMVLGAAVALASPCYWMGFIEREEVWLAPGLAAVLIARVFVRGGAVKVVGGERVG